MDNDVLQLLKLSLKESNPLILKNLLKVCSDSKLFQKPHCKVENIITLVNSLINISSDCENGISILKVLLPQCKSDVIGTHLLQWLQLCTKGLHFNRPSAAHYELLRELIIYSKNYPDIKKQTSLTIIPKILDYHFKGSRTVSFKTEVPFLICFEEILSNYGKACGSFRGKIEQFLLSKLVSSSDIVQLCARCYLNLLAASPIGQNKDDFVELWYKKQLFFISALHQQLDNLFHSINEIQGIHDKYIIEYDRKCIPEISEKSPLEKAQSLTNLFINLVHFFSVVLLGPYPVEKSVNSEAIFSVICRGLSVNCSTLEASVTSDTLILSTQIPSIQEACLGLLATLIKSCRRELYSHGPLVCKLLTQTLKWTKVDKFEYGQEKPYCSLRVITYSCFTDWLTDARKCSSVENYINDIMPSILADVHYNKPSVTLSIAAKRLKGKVGKKQRKINQVNSSLESTMPNVVNLEANKEVCKAALNFIPSLLQAAYDTISPAHHKQLQELIINEITMVQVGKALSLEVPIPYTCDSCRYGLFNALLAICNYYHPEFTCPVNYAVSLFEAGTNDLSLEISRMCGQAVANVEKLINPIGCTLKYPLKLSAEVSSSVNNQPDPLSNQVLNVLDESIAGQSISKLFEVETSSKSTDNSEHAETSVTKQTTSVAANDATKMDDIDKFKLVSNKDVITQNNYSIKQKSIQLKISDNNCQNDVDLVEKSSKNNDSKSNNSSVSVFDKISVESNKRSIDDIDNDVRPIEKKKKDNLNETSPLVKTINDELEDVMLSSFVDIVK